MAVSSCSSATCQNGGVCQDLWSDYFCECKSPFIGSNCATGKEKKHTKNILFALYYQLNFQVIDFLIHNKMSRIVPSVVNKNCFIFVSFAVLSKSLLEV